MNAIVKAMAGKMLRHYRDPTSWAGVVTELAAAANIHLDAGIAGNIETILASLIGIVLIAMDGRVNPHTDPGTGAISVRSAAATTGISPAAAGAGRDVLAGNRPAARTANDELDPPGFNDNGPN
jgi:hypothetical protein